MNCPHCGATMAKVRVASGKVEVDCCDTHGVWLDNGELQKIVAEAEQRASPAFGGGPAAASPAPKEQPGVFDGVGRQLVSTAVSGAGFGLGTSVASTLVRKIFGG